MRTFECLAWESSFKNGSPLKHHIAKRLYPPAERMEAYTSPE